MSKPLIAIVGAGSGVSAAVARKFGENGFRVALVSRSGDRLKQLTEDLAELQIEAAAFQADAASEQQIADAFQSIANTLGTPDVLVYNAAAISTVKPSELKGEQLLDELKVNVAGALYSVQQVIPQFIESGSGTILVTGGGFGIHPNFNYSSLSLGKAAVRSLAYSLADELKPHGVYVGTVTIGGYVSKGTFYDPDIIAERFWDLFQNRDRVEEVFADDASVPAV
ncbi:SDR family NAD(P)-dependent oxidoreductase [Paenibacillus sp. NPDC058071]|uniref:SDR family NAD(P)-dependent oxidoreductase n=1 Tax=Paenibacillus sp. NPDC058071 TaxID=3346326 RepID=UPI0036DAAA1A